MNVLIIEDEKAAARNLISLLGEIDPNIMVTAVLDSVVDSVEWLKNHSEFHLIFMDIHLADGSAFEIFERCTVKHPIVFTTAYDEYALKAFKVNSIDYLLKPINSNDLKSALAKYHQLHTIDKEAEQTEKLKSLLQSMQHTRRYTAHLLLPKGGSQLIPLPTNQVACFFIEDGVVRAKTKEGMLYTVPHTLDQLTEMLDPAIFFRANRQYIITREDVLYMELWFGSRLLVRLHSQTEAKVIINKPRVSEFKVWFSGMQ